MSEGFPYRQDSFNFDSGEVELSESGPGNPKPVLATQLVSGMRSADHGNKRIERVTPVSNGQISVLFERTEEERQQNREGTTVFLDRDEYLKISPDT